MTFEEEDKYDLFISHKRATGGHLAITIKLLLLEKNPNLNIYLDVDDLENIHDLEKNIKNSENLLLLITNDVFNSNYVIHELDVALKNKKNIIILWDKDNCPSFPDMNLVPKHIRSVLYIKAITWVSENIFRDIIINEIIKRLKNIFFTIYNVDNSEYLYSSNLIYSVSNIYNIKNKRAIFTSKNVDPLEKEKYYWKFIQHKNQKQIYLIYNQFHNEYLYSSELSFEDNSRRNIYNSSIDNINKIDEKFYWIITLNENDEYSICNFKTKEYLYASTLLKYDEKRRKVFTFNTNRGKWFIKKN